MSQRFLINPPSGPGLPIPGLQSPTPTTNPGPFRSIDIGSLILDNCQWTEPKARFGFVTQLSDKQVWTVTITRSKRGVRREYLSASGSSIDACFLQLLTLSSQAATHHINNQGFNYPTELRIHSQADADGDDGSSGEEQASAPVSDDESDWGEDDCEGPASFVSVAPSASSQSRGAARGPSRRSRSKEVARLASMLPAHYPPPTRPPQLSATLPPPPPPPPTSQQRSPYNDPPPPPPPTVRSSQVVDAPVGKKATPKPRPACLLINVPGGPAVASVLTEVLPSQKEIEKKARLLVEERGLDSHIDEKASLCQSLTIAKVSFTSALENQYDLEHFGDDLSALFSIMNNGLPHFSIDVKYSELP